jgi:hypothetical protein
MKTKTLWLICISLLFALQGKAQPPTNCSIAVTYSYPINQTVTAYSDASYWFKVTVDSGSYRIKVANSTGSFKIDSATVYTGSCASLTYVRKDTLPDSTGNLWINLYDTVTTTYSVRLHNAGGSATFSVTTIGEVYIVGDMGFCPGQTIQLSACLINRSGTSSYTWTPSGLHTPLINIAPTVTTTYTLNYLDGQGTVTTTVSVFPLPAAACNNCEMVPNGSFEAYQYRHNKICNILTPSVCNNNATAPMSDPLGWISPTCATPDYFNGDFPFPDPYYHITYQSVGVPKNGMSNYTPAHSGRGYAGFITFSTGGNREYIQEPLKCPLVNGQLYNVSFYTSLANFYVNPCDLSNNIGAYLSVTTPTNTGVGRIGNTPQANANGIINNLGSWAQVAGTMTGNGEKCITIGNFYTNANTLVNTYTTSNVAYYFVDDISVTPVPLSLSASNCQSGTVTISAYGAPSSTLTTWYGPGSYTATGSSISIPSPTIATTYTCSVNLGGSCPNCTVVTSDRLSFVPCTTCNSPTQTITIQPQTPCSGNEPASYTVSSSGTYSPTTGYLANTLYINSGSYTITCADLRIASTASITVASGATLVISNSWLHVCNPCNGVMWPGITVQNNGTLIVTNSIIEDATKAIYTASSATTTPIPSYTITGSILNNNSYGVYVDTHQGNLSANTIYNTVFTCRSLSDHTIANIGTTKSDIAAATTLLPSATNPIGLTIAGGQCLAGIYVNAVNIAHPVNVGLKTQSYNIFDNLRFGIRAYESSVTAKNNHFQNLRGNNTGGVLFGVGIFSDASTQFASVKATLIAGNSNTTVDNTEKNYFTNNLMGIYTNRMLNVYINNNYFDNEVTATTFSTSGTFVTGQYGVYQNAFAYGAGTTSLENLQFANNNCNNFATGHYLDFGKLYNTSQSMLISTNTITATFNSANQYCNYGIYTQQNSSNGANTGVPNYGFKITSNTISNININCIYATAINNNSATNGFFDVEQNTELSIKYSTGYTSLQTPRIAAVRVNGCYYSRVSDNSKICSFGSNAFGCQYQAGIYVTQSPNSIITCNNIYNIGEDIVFESTSPTYNNNMSRNTMDNSMYGFVLRSGGIIGDQGTSTFPHDNIWGYSSDFTAQTLSDNSNPSSGVTSKLYCRAASCGSGNTYMPCTNVYTGTTTPTPYSNTGGTPTLITASGSSNQICSSDGGGTGGRMAAGQTDMGAADSLHYQNIQSTLYANTNPYPVYDAETRWALQLYVSSALPNLTPARGYEHAKTLAMADVSFAAGDYGTALSLTQSFTASNAIESNWQTVNTALLKMQNDTLNATDISSLQQVASQCHLTGGNIVWKARALLNSYYKTIIEYPNACPVINSGAGAKVENTAGLTNTTTNQTINLYPNPNNGTMTLEYNITKDAYLEISNTNGTLVGKYTLSSSGNKLDIKNDNLSSGIYLYRVVNDAVLKTGRIVIIK